MSGDSILSSLYDASAERAVVGAAVGSVSACDQLVEMLSAEDFGYPFHSDVFGVVTELPTKSVLSGPCLTLDAWRDFWQQMSPDSRDSLRRIPTLFERRVVMAARKSTRPYSDVWQMANDRASDRVALQLAEQVHELAIRRRLAQGLEDAQQAILAGKPLQRANELLALVQEVA